jgi:hypothetical protein
MSMTTTLSLLTAAGIVAGLAFSGIQTYLLRKQTQTANLVAATSEARATIQHLHEMLDAIGTPATSNANTVESSSTPSSAQSNPSSANNPHHDPPSGNGMLRNGVAAISIDRNGILRNGAAAKSIDRNGILRNGVDAIGTPDAVLVPGLAVPSGGMRLGRGGGSSPWWR